MERVTETKFNSDCSTADNDDNDFYAPERLSWLEKVKDTYSIAKNELLKTSFKGKVALSSLIIMTTYEWGPGNETLTPIIGGQSLDAADGLPGIALTASISGGFVATQQLTASYLARKSSIEFPELSKTIYNHTNNQSGDISYKKFAELPKTKKLAYSAFLGSTFNVLREATVVGNNDENELKKVGKTSALISGGSVALIGAGVDTINQTFDSNEAVQFTMDWFVKNPVFWLGAMGIYLASDHYRAKKQNQRQ